MSTDILRARKIYLGKICVSKAVITDIRSLFFSRDGCKLLTVGERSLFNSGLFSKNNGNKLFTFAECILAYTRSREKVGSFKGSVCKRVLPYGFNVVKIDILKRFAMIECMIRNCLR